jgi:hypothetical protein
MKLFRLFPVDCASFSDSALAARLSSSPFFGREPPLARQLLVSN